MSTLEIVERLFAALVLGGLIGLERQWRSHYVGLRTNTLLTLGAASVMMLGHIITFNNAAAMEHIASQVITGVGLLCAGVIMREGATAKGFNTAATFWCSVIIGLFCGTALYEPAILITICVIGINLFFGRVDHMINKITTTKDPEFPPG
jgi:putative Mg2+ transporter-C (MgtC) family protein